MNLRYVILPKKVLQDGRHRIRLAFSHRGDTRYFMTDYYLASPKGLVNGEVSSKVAGARDMNVHLKGYKDKIEQAFHNIEGADFYSCAEVVELIKEQLNQSKPRTILDIYDEMVEKKKLSGLNDQTIYVYQVTRGAIARFFPAGTTMQSLREIDLLRFKDHLLNNRIKPSRYGLAGMSQSSVCIVLCRLKAAYMYAVKRHYFSPNIEIWDDVKIPSATKRDCELSIDELRRLRDLPLDGVEAQSRDLLMLSFYLCGMNLIDVLEQDFTKDVVEYMRAKTRSRRRSGEYTRFTIQPEARAILDRYIDAKGRFQMRGGIKLESIKKMLIDNLPAVGSKLGIQKQFIYYSARHTFGQLCLELGVPDAVMAYCVGDAPKAGSIDFYRSTTQRLADYHIRRVFDFVASTQSLEDAIGIITNKTT